MFCHPVLMGAVGGFLAVKLIHRLRHHHHHHGHFRHFRGGPARLFWIARELELDRRQKQEIWAVMREVRRSVGELRFGRIEGMDAIADALSSETFDKAAVEAAAAKQGEAFAEVRAKVVAGLERVHAILRPEQRERLREILSGVRDHDGGGPPGGPYRTAL
jgi:Spy/CpxP family protein refolding chaperone